MPASWFNPVLAVDDCAVHNDFILPKTNDDKWPAYADVLPKLRRWWALFSCCEDDAALRFVLTRLVTIVSEFTDVSRDDSPFWFDNKWNVFFLLGFLVKCQLPDNVELFSA